MNLNKKWHLSHTWLHFTTLFLLILILSNIVNSTYLNYDNPLIYFGNDTRLNVSTCVKNTCYPGFLTITGDASINSSAQPSLDSLIAFNVDYALPFNNESCLIRIVSETPLRELARETNDSILFTDGKGNFVLSKQTDLGMDYQLSLANGQICVGSLNNQGRLHFYLESTGKNNPIDYYHARLYTVVTIGPEESLVDIPKELKPSILGVYPFEFSEPEIIPQINFSDGCSDLIYYFTDSFGEKNTTGCSFNSPMIVVNYNSYLTPFDYYVAEITTNKDISNITDRQITVKQPDYVGTVTADKKTVSIKIQRKDSWVYLLLVIVVLLGLVVSYFQKSSIAITLSVIWCLIPIISFTKYSLVPISFVVYFVSIFILYKKRSYWLEKITQLKHLFSKPS